MFQISGEETLDQTAEVVWQALSRPAFLCQCFPGVDRLVRCDDRSAALIVRPGFSFIRGTLEISFELVETDPSSSARILVHMKGIGSSAELETRMNLTSDNQCTHVTWHVRALEVGGLLKAVSQGLMQAAAQKVASDTWSEIRKELK